MAFFKQQRQFQGLVVILESFIRCLLEIDINQGHINAVLLGSLTGCERRV